MGETVIVGGFVAVGVLVGVSIGVFIGVSVGVLIGVSVGVLAGVLVGVFDGVFVGVGRGGLPDFKASSRPSKSALIVWYAGLLCWLTSWYGSLIMS